MARKLPFQPMAQSKGRSIIKEPPPISSPQSESMPVGAVGDCIVVAPSDSNTSNVSDNERHLPLSNLKAESEMLRGAGSPMPWAPRKATLGSSREGPIEIPDSDEEKEYDASKHARATGGDNSDNPTLSGRSSAIRRASVNQRALATPNNDAMSLDSNRPQSLAPRPVKIPLKLVPPENFAGNGNAKGVTKSGNNTKSNPVKRALSSLSPAAEQSEAKRRAIAQPSIYRKDRIILSPISPPPRSTSFSPGRTRTPASNVGVLTRADSVTSNSKRTTATTINHPKTTPAFQNSSPEEIERAYLRMNKMQELESDEKQRIHENSIIITRLKNETNERRRLEKDLLFAKAQMESLEEEAKMLRVKLVDFTQREFRLFEITYNIDPLDEDETKWFRQNMSNLARSTHGPVEQLCRIVDDIQTRVNINLSSTIEDLGGEITACIPKLESLEATNGQLAARCALNESQLNAKVQESETSQLKIADLEQKMAILKEDNLKLKGLLGETEKTLRDEVDAISTRKDQEILNLRTENEKLFSETTQLKWDIVNMADASTKLKHENGSLETDLGDLRDDFAKVIKQNEDLKTRVAELEQQKDKMGGQIQNGERQLEETRNEKAAWETDRKLLLGNESQLRLVVAALEKEVEDLKKNASAQSGRLQQLRGEQELWRAEEDELATKAQALAKELRDQKFEFNARIAEQAKQLEDARKESSTSMAQAATLQLEMSKQVLTLKQTTDDLGLVQTQKNELETSLQVQAKSLDETKTESRIMQGRLDSIAALCAKGIAFYQRPRQAPSGVQLPQNTGPVPPSMLPAPLPAMNPGPPDQSAASEDVSNMPPPAKPRSILPAAPLPMGPPAPQDRLIPPNLLPTQPTWQQFHRHQMPPTQQHSSFAAVPAPGQTGIMGPTCMGHEQQ